MMMKSHCPFILYLLLLLHVVLSSGTNKGRMTNRAAIRPCGSMLLGRSYSLPMSSSIILQAE